MGKKFFICLSLIMNINILADFNNAMRLLSEHLQGKGDLPSGMEDD